MSDLNVIPSGYWATDVDGVVTRMADFFRKALEEERAAHSKPILDAKGGSRTGEGELGATSGDHDANEAS